MNSGNLDKFHYDDLMADLSSSIEHYGARRVLLDFKERYPQHHHELTIQIHQQEKLEKVPALCKAK
jgi:hypothetical protein